MVAERSELAADLMKIFGISLNKEIFRSRTSLWDVLVAFDDAMIAIDALKHEPNSSYRALELERIKLLPKSEQEAGIDKFRFLGWSPDTFKLAELIDAVNRNSYILMLLKQVKTEAFPPSYRPHMDSDKEEVEPVDEDDLFGLSESHFNSRLVQT